MQLISKCNKRICFLLFVINIFCKYLWIIPLKDKKSITIANNFHKILNKSNCKANKIGKDKDRTFYNRSIKSWLEKKCNRNVYHRTIKIKAVDVKPSI